MCFSYFRLRSSGKTRHYWGRKGSKSKQRARCLETGLKIDRKTSLTYCYLRGSAPKSLRFREGCGEKRKGSFRVAKRQSEKQWRYLWWDNRLVQTEEREKPTELKTRQEQLAREWRAKSVRGCTLSKGGSHSEHRRTHSITVTGLKRRWSMDWMNSLSSKEIRIPKPEHWTRQVRGTRSNSGKHI